MKNWQLILTLPLSSYSKFRDILHTFNVYRVTEKEHQVAYRSDADDMSVW